MTDRSELTATWALYSSGRQLSEAEYACLEEALNDDASGHELAADQRLHRMLTALGAIDKTKDDFVANVMAECSGVELSTTMLPERSVPLTTFPQAVPAVPTTTPMMVRQRGKNKTVLLHPLVLVLGGGTLALALMLLVMLDRYHSMQQQVVAAGQQLQNQQTDFENRMTAERNRKISQPLPTPVAVSDKSYNTPPTTAQNQPAPPPAHEIIQPVARLAQSGTAVWKKAPTSASLSAGRWDLESGTAQLAMSGGSRIELTAPVTIELISPHHVSLDRGTLTATVPADDIGFRVSTPNARIVDLGTQFRVSVDERGETNVDVDRGEVVVIPWDAESGGKRWHLVAGKLDKATVCPSTGAGRDMLASRVSGPDGFQGQIRLAGASLELTSRDHFDRLRDGVTAQMATSPAEVLDNWLELTRTFNSTSGSITMNGKEVPFAGLDGVMDFENLLLNSGNVATSVDSQQSSAFQGKVNINGQERSFNNKEEYEAFRKEMLKSLQGFGIPGPAQMQLELDKQKNPFQP